MLQMWTTASSGRIIETLLHSRPIHEAYQVFHLFCLGGNLIPAKSFMILLERLGRAICLPRRPKAGSILPDLPCNMDLLRAMFRALEVYTNAGGVLDERHMDCFIRGVLVLSPLVSSTSQGSQRGWKEPETSTGTVVRRLVSRIYIFFGSYGVIPSSLLKFVMKDMKNTHVPVYRILRRRLLRTAGRLEDQPMIHPAWQGLRDVAERSRIPLTSDDWADLAVATETVDNRAYYREQAQYHLGNDFELNREIKSKTLGIASTFDNVVWNGDDQKQIRSFCAKI